MFWVINKENSFPIRTLIWGHELVQSHRSDAASDKSEVASDKSKVASDKSKVASDKSEVESQNATSQNVPIGFHKIRFLNQIILQSIVDETKRSISANGAERCSIL